MRKGNVRGNGLGWVLISLYKLKVEERGFGKLFYFFKLIFIEEKDVYFVLIFIFEFYINIIIDFLRVIV